MDAKTKDLWVFIETGPDGTAKNVGLENNFYIDDYNLLCL